MSQSPEDPGPVTAPDGSTIYDPPETGTDREADDTEDLEPDDAPDAWLDSEDLYEELTEHEAEEGRLMGERIDTGDDEDAGG